MLALDYRGPYHAAHALTCMRKSCKKEKTYGPQGTQVFNAVALCVLLFPWLIAVSELQRLPSCVFSVLSSALVHGSLVFAAFSIATLRLVMGLDYVASTQGVLLSRHLACAVNEDYTVTSSRDGCVEDGQQPGITALFSRTPMMLSMVSWAGAVF